MSTSWAPARGVSARSSVAARAASSLAPAGGDMGGPAGRYDVEGGDDDREYSSRVSEYWQAVGAAREWVGSSQPWNRFLGWQGWDGRIETMSASMKRAWSVPPTKAEFGDRVSQNLSHYLTNYGVICLVTLLYIIVTHWALLFWSTLLLTLYVSWDNRHFLANQAGFNFPDFRLPIRPQHTTLLFSIVGCILVLTLIGHDVFVFIGMASTLVLSHAIFRTPLAANPKKSDGVGTPMGLPPPSSRSRLGLDEGSDAAPSQPRFADDNDGNDDDDGNNADTNDDSSAPLV